MAARFCQRTRQRRNDVTLPHNWFRANEDPYVVVLDDVFTPEECQYLIDASEQSELYEQAKINIGGGREMLLTDTRNSDRAIVDSPQFAELLWQRIMSKVEDDPRLTELESIAPGANMFAVGLNERMRFLRYDSGAFFAAHFDGCYKRGPLDKSGQARQGERSFVTCQLYLNDGEQDFQGGATSFLSMHGDTEERVEVVPKPGRVLLFQHGLYHEGSCVTAGRKYCIRTDVMYSKVGPTYAEVPVNVEGGTSSGDALLMGCVGKTVDVPPDAVCESADGDDADATAVEVEDEICLF